MESPILSQKAFTLLELMIAIIIIGILATAGLVTYASTQKNARISKRLQDLQALQTAIELFKSSTGAYPVNATPVCITSAASGISGLVPTYMPALPRDPASPNCYWYQSDATGTEYKIRTGGDSSTAANSEMTSADFNQQAALIDPNRDGGVVSTCAIETTCTDPGPPPVTISCVPAAWAYYTLGGCGY